jgi:phosphoribosylanthranilate isomerase
MLRYVTVTGIDDGTNLLDFLTIAKKYPFVEWGVLIYDSLPSHKSRYPNYDVFRDLAKCKNVLPQINLSLHVCGPYLRKIIHNGDWKVFDDIDINSIDNITSSFNRVQLNLSNMIGEIQEPFFESLKNINQEIILQLKSVEGNEELIEKCSKNAKISVLFDASGGKGKLPEKWPNSIKNCGYAGGLTPDNVKEQLCLIKNLVGDNGPIWIDAESSLRSYDEFNLIKVEEFLINSLPFVEKES